MIQLPLLNLHYKILVVVFVIFVLSPCQHGQRHEKRQVKLNRLGLNLKYEALTLSDASLIYTEKVIALNECKACSLLIHESRSSSNRTFNDKTSDKLSVENSNSLDFARFYSFLRDFYVLNDIKGRNGKKNSPLRRLKRFGANCIVSLIALNVAFNHHSSAIESENEVGQGINGQLKYIEQLLTLPFGFERTKRNTDFFLFFTRGGDETKTVERILLNEHVGFRYKYKLIINTSTNDATTMTSVYSLCFYCKHGLPQIFQIDMTEENPQFFPKMLMNFKGAVITGSGFSSPSSQMRKVNGEYRPFKTGGTYLRNYLQVAETLNFTYKFGPGGGSGLKAKNGTWYGVVADIFYRKADIGFCIGLNRDRFEAVEFSSEVEYTTLTFAHGPTRPIYTAMAVFWPFSLNLWLGVVFSTLLCILFLFGNSYFVKNVLIDLKLKGMRRTYTLMSHEYWTISEVIMFIMPSFLCQHNVEVRSNSLRIFVTFWWLYILVLSTVYLSKLFGFFVEPPAEEAPTTFAEVAASDFNIGMTYFGGALYSWFGKASPDSPYGQIFPRMKKQKTLDCLRDTTVLEKRHVCISYDVSIQFAVETKIGDRYGRSNIVIEPSIAYQLPVSLITEKNSIFIQSISRVTSVSFEGGLTALWRTWSHTELRNENRRASKNGTTSDPDEGKLVQSNEPIQLNLQHFTGAFTILFYGVLISSVFLFYEDRKLIRKHYKDLPHILFKGRDRWKRHHWDDVVGSQSQKPATPNTSFNIDFRMTDGFHGENVVSAKKGANL